MSLKSTSRAASTATTSLSSTSAASHATCSAASAIRLASILASSAILAASAAAALASSNFLSLIFRLPAKIMEVRTRDHLLRAAQMATCLLTLGTMTFSMSPRMMMRRLRSAIASASRPIHSRRDLMPRQIDCTRMSRAINLRCRAFFTATCSLMIKKGAIAPYLNIRCSCISFTATICEWKVTTCRRRASVQARHFSHSASSAIRLASSTKAARQSLSSLASNSTWCIRRASVHRHAHSSIMTAARRWRMIGRKNRYTRCLRRPDWMTTMAEKMNPVVDTVSTVPLMHFKTSEAIVATSGRPGWPSRASMRILWTPPPFESSVTNSSSVHRWRESSTAVRSSSSRVSNRKGMTNANASACSTSFFVSPAPRSSSTLQIFASRASEVSCSLGSGLPMSVLRPARWSAHGEKTQVSRKLSCCSGSSRFGEAE